MGRNRARVIITNHYSERYRERVGKAPPFAQRSWIQRSMRERTTKRLSDGKFSIKLVGSRHEAVLAKEGNVWVAVTVK